MMSEVGKLDNEDIVEKPGTILATCFFSQIFFEAILVRISLLSVKTCVDVQ